MSYFNKKIGIVLFIMVLIGASLSTFIFAEGELSLTATAKANMVTLKWSYSTVTASYLVKRNGEVIATVDGSINEYEDKANITSDTIYSYTVSALDSEQTVLDSAGISVFVRDSSEILYKMIYGNESIADSAAISSLCTSQSWLAPYYTTENTIVGGYSMQWKLPKSKIKSGELIQYTLANKDMSAISEDGYLECLVYADASNTADLPTSLMISTRNISLPSGWGNVSFPLNLELNKWNFVSIKLSDAIDKSANPADTRSISFVMPSSTLSADYNLYVQNMGFYNRSDIKITNAEVSHNTVSLEWEYNNDNVAGYKIYCNGKELNTVGATINSYSYEVSESDTVYTYFIEALDNTGGVMSTSSEKTVVVYNRTKYNYQMIYGATNSYDTTALINACTNKRGQTPTYVTTTTALSGYSMKWALAKNSMQMDECMQYTLAKTDMSKIKEDGYIEFLIYTDAVSKADLPTFQISTRDPANSSSWKNITYDITNQVELNKWSFVKFKLSDAAKSGAFIENIRALNFYPPNSFSADYNIYIQNLGFYSLIYPPTAAVTASGIDEKGNSYVDLQFSKSMDNNTITTSGFWIDGFSCVGATYSDGEHTGHIVFERPFEFPKDYTLVIGETVKDNYDTAFDNKNITFTTPDFHNQIAVTNLNVDKSRINDGIVVCNADVTAIYEENGKAQSITMVVMLCKGDKIIAIASDSVTDIERKATASLSATVSSQMVTSEDNCTVNVYFIDSIDGVKPLCKYYNK